MAKDKSKIVFYTDWGNIFNALPKEQAGELIQHLCKYVNDENPPELPGLLNVVWIPMRDALKRDLRKYEAVCDKNKENIRKRWDKKDTTVYDRIKDDTKNTDKDKDKDKDIKEKYKKENTTHFSPPELKEVAIYFKEKGSTVLEAQKFHGFYESKGWMVGKNKMKSWKGAAGGWLARNKEDSAKDRFKPQFT